jgi:hypothetical protein
MFKNESYRQRDLVKLKEKKADLFRNGSSAKCAFNAWKQFVLDQKEQRWKEFRKERLRAIAKDQLSQISTLQDGP